MILAGFFGVLFAASLTLPGRGERAAPANRLVSGTGSPSAGSYYLSHAYEQTHTENTVTAVLADYRAFDTLGETLVVFVAGVACTVILRRKDPSR
jgi:multicomponent Na+:H+ antiporter subunit B